jgi:hypothetical protein
MIMIASNRRFVIIGGLAAALVFVWSLRLLPWDHEGAWTSTKQTFAKLTSGQAALSSSGVLPHVDDYFEQVFSVGKPKQRDYPGIEDYCSSVDWKEDVYVDCIGIVAGMTSIISQVKVCLKMAIDSGSNLILPTIPLRDSKDLLEFNFLNQDAYMVYDQWFDVDHLRDVMARSCPKMKILHPKELDAAVPVKNKW